MFFTLLLCSDCDLFSHFWKDLNCVVSKGERENYLGGFKVVLINISHVICTGKKCTEA